MMKIEPIKFSDFGLVKIKTTNDCLPTPHCKLHGAMNKMNTFEDGGGYWRCISYVTQANDTACRAGCCEIKSIKKEGNKMINRLKRVGAFGIAIGLCPIWLIVWFFTGRPIMMDLMLYAVTDPADKEEQ